MFPAQFARADQIVALIDGHGRKVYINTGEPSTRIDWTTRNFRQVRIGAPVLPSAEIDRLVEQTADRFRVDPQLVHAIIRVESEYDPSAVSRKGAMGLMQLIPATAQRFGVDNPFDPRQNIEGGVNYLKYLLDMFAGNLPLSLAAYNAGEHSVLRSGGIPAFTETRDYVRKVTHLYKSGAPLAPSKAGAAGPAKAPIIRYVDANGVVHYTNVD
jgi:soluble lytic murein transglycosylase-like protein